MKPTVCLIEDDPGDVEISRVMLERSGCDVITCNDADSALKYVDGLFRDSTLARPDLFLIDVKLPSGRSGIEVLRAIKMYMPHIPTVIVTGFPDSDTIRQATVLGYVGIVEKPITTLDMEEILKIHKIAMD